MERPESIEVLIRDLISHQTETEWIEFKENNASPEDIGEYLSALSNSALLTGQSKGYLCFGIENGSHRIAGTLIEPGNMRKGAELLEPWLARLLEPRMEYPEREAKLWNKVRGYAYEEGIAAEDLSDEDVLTSLDIGAYFDIFGQAIPDRAYVFDRLEKDRLIGQNRGKRCITNMGALLLAKDLRQFSRQERKSVRIIQYRGRGRTDTLAEHEVRKGYAVGYSGLIAYIMDRLSTGETIEQGFRKSGSPYPEIIMREIIANALIHQDFEISGAGPLVELFSDRVEITNPGAPIISPLRFIDHPPRSRNEKLASFMRRANICEERGSGIDKAVSALESQVMPPLRFIEEEEFFKVVVLSPRPFRDLDANDRINACYQHCCLRHAENSPMTNKSLRERLGIEEKNYSMVSRVIADAKETGLVKDADPQYKSRRDARYVPFYA